MKVITAAKKYNISKAVLWVVVACALLGLLALIVWGFMQTPFDVSFYEVKSNKVEDNIRVVGISDLHLKQFGKDNVNLIVKIKELSPDLIAVAGDLTIQSKPTYEVALSLLRQLKDIAPVYYCYGNHEYYDILFNKNSTMLKDIANTGVNVVNNSYETVKVKNSTLAIGGFCTRPENFSDNAEPFLKKFEKDSHFKLLLSHYVEVFEENMEGYPVDLAITGHAHGGHARLPFIGPLYAPDQGLFPKLTEGMHELCGSNLVITRGLGNSHLIPRFNNNPEIVVIDINWY